MNTNTETSGKLRVFTWHIHGNYLYYLTQTPCEFYIPRADTKGDGYSGRTASFPWGDNLHEIPADEVKNYEFDCILFQSTRNYLTDQYEILSPEQRNLPKLYLEHDPPREVPTDTHHPVDDPDTLLVHVTHFNELMWNNNRTPTTVIQHGIKLMQPATYKGSLEKGIVVVNNIKKRGRRLGLDIFERVCEEIPLDLVGMNSKDAGGLGEIPNQELPDFISQYRFFFNPIRYTSLGLAVCEAMLIGLPIIGLATTEMAVTVKNGQSGYVHTDVNFLIDKMKLLLQQPELAAKLGQGAAEEAVKKFNIQRFTDDWLQVFSQVTGRVARETIQTYAL